MISATISLSVAVVVTTSSSQAARDGDFFLRGACHLYLFYKKVSRFGLPPFHIFLKKASAT
jgi:hypothetical protein